MSSFDLTSSHSSSIDPATASAVIDLGAFTRNVRALQTHVGAAQMMIVVKADAYGHGMLACSRAARRAGVGWLGVATPAEALLLRADGDTGRVLAWLYGPDEDLTPLVAAGVDVSVQSLGQLSRLVGAAGTAEQTARIHLKIDTGLSRNGMRPEGWGELCAAAAEARDAGAVEVVAVWSHFAAADEPGHPSQQVQLTVFEWAVETAHNAGLTPLAHLASSAAALVLPATHFDLVRIGIAAYGIDPAPGIITAAGVDLSPVMTLRAQLVSVKTLQAGDGVSYGHTWLAEQSTSVGLVGLGYGDGVPRHASNTAEVAVRGVRAPIRGRVCMDQFVIDLGRVTDAAEGDEVILFGPGTSSEPTVLDWAGWCDTIGYEIVTRVGSRVQRVNLGGES